MPGDNSDWIQEKQTDAEHDFLASGGEMGARVRALDRSKTPPVSRRITGGSMRVRSSAKAEKMRDDVYVDPSDFKTANSRPGSGVGGVNRAMKTRRNR